MIAFLFAPFCMAVLVGATIAVSCYDRRHPHTTSTTTYTFHGEQITEADARDISARTGQPIFEHPEAHWDAWVEDALRLTRPTPPAFDNIAAIVAHNEAARNLTDDRLRDWVGEA